jgi:hypothetical protein
MKCSWRRRRRPMRSCSQVEPDPVCTCDGSGELPVYFSGMVIATVPCPGCDRG